MLKRCDGQSGIALLIVLAVLGAISMIALLVVGDSTRLVGEASFARDELRSRQAEDAALAIFGLSLSNPIAKRSFRLDLGGASVEVEAKPEAAKLDLNLSDETTLARFFSFVLQDQDRGVRIAAAIADWRDPDGMTRLNGAEDSAYSEAGLTSGPRNEEFRAVDDLRAVLGLNDKLFECVRPFLSVRSGTQLPDARDAPPILIRALGLSVQTQQTGAASIVSPLGSQSGDVYEVVMAITLGDGPPKRNVAYTLRALGDPREPLAILERRPLAEEKRRSQSACASLGVPKFGPP